MFSTIRKCALQYLALLVLWMAAAVQCCAQTEQTQWSRYRTNNDQFSVTLPAVPAMTTQMNWNNEIQKWHQERSIGAYADGVVYAIYILENDAHKTLESFANTNLSSRLVSWDSIREVIVNNVTGRQYLLPRSSVGGVIQFFTTGERLYQFEAVGAPQDDPRVAKFFSSISFSSSPEGADIVDGAGIPWRLPSAVANLHPELNRIFSGKEIDRKAIIVSKREPQYTELARKNRVQGAVVLKAVFSRDGAVDDITIVSGQPDGLTEIAVAATKQIKFIPAVKNGQFVSIWMQFEYNFSLY